MVIAVSKRYVQAPLTDTVAAVGKFYTMGSGINAAYTKENKMAPIPTTAG